MAVCAPLLSGPFGLAAERNKGDAVVSQCLVSINHDVEVPAQEPGILVSLDAREGMHVKKDVMLGKIDDIQRQMERKVAMIEHVAAKEKAGNDIDVRFARASSSVAKAEYEQAVDANAKVKGAFPKAEVRRLKLAWNKAFLQIEQAGMDQRLAGLTMSSRAAEVETAEVNIGRRKIVAPLEGEIVAVYKHVGEWVNPGDPVLRIVHLNRLRVEGYLKITDYIDSQIADKPVTVSARLAQGEVVEFTGKIVYVSPLVEAGGEYRVWAEVANRKQGSRWLLKPGLDASMTIHIDREATTEQSPRTKSPRGAPQESQR